MACANAAAKYLTQTLARRCTHLRIRAPRDAPRAQAMRRMRRDDRLRLDVDDGDVPRLGREREALAVWALPDEWPCAASASGGCRAVEPDASAHITQVHPKLAASRLDHLDTARQTARRGASLLFPALIPL